MQVGEAGDETVKTHNNHFVNTNGRATPSENSQNQTHITEKVIADGVSKKRIVLLLPSKIGCKTWFYGDKKWGYSKRWFGPKNNHRIMGLGLNSIVQNLDYRHLWGNTEDTPPKLASRCNYLNISHNRNDETQNKKTFRTVTFRHKCLFMNGKPNTQSSQSRPGLFFRVLFALQLIFQNNVEIKTHAFFRTRFPNLFCVFLNHHQ